MVNTGLLEIITEAVLALRFMTPIWKQDMLRHTPTRPSMVR